MINLANLLEKLVNVNVLLIDADNRETAYLALGEQLSFSHLNYIVDEIRSGLTSDGRPFITVNVRRLI